MNQFPIYETGNLTKVCIEDTAPVGIKRVAATVCKDIGLVTGKEPEQVGVLSQVTGGTVILAGICGESKIMTQLEEQGVVDALKIKGKRECYLLKIVVHPFPAEPQIEKALVILGSASEKRGACSVF